MIFRLGESKVQGHNGHTVLQYRYIERETPRAVLFTIERSGEDMPKQRDSYWLPRSQIKISDDRLRLEVPDWLWQKKMEGE